MANPRVFISSTCYDLAEIRDSLVDFISSFGFDPILSERGDVFYHPDLHTHESCLSEVGNCQMFVLIIGGRFGGSYKSDPKKSIVNAEYLTAKEESIPVFTFVKKNVHADHHVYISNRQTKVLSQIHFPSIDNQEHALRIFEFIDKVKASPVNNGYFAFEFARDIATLLRKQWSGMFFDFLQKRDASNQLSTTTSLIKNVSLAGEKVEELLKSLYRHIDKVGAEQSIESVEKRSTARQFFSEAVSIYEVKNFKGDIRKTLSSTPREGKWYEYIAKALGGKLIEEKWRKEKMPAIAIKIGNCTTAVDSKDTESRFAISSNKLQSLFSTVSTMSDDDIAEIVQDIRWS